MYNVAGPTLGDLVCDIYEAMVAIDPAVGEPVPVGYDQHMRILGLSTGADGTYGYCVCVSM